MSEFMGFLVAMLILFGFPFSIIWFIVSLIKKKGIKKALMPLGIIIISIVVCSIIGVAASPNTDSGKERVENNQEQREIEQSEKERKIVEKKKRKETELASEKENKEVPESKNANKTVELETTSETIVIEEKAEIEAVQEKPEKDESIQLETEIITEEIEETKAQTAREIVMAERNDFLTNAIEVTYEDLRRYPDSHKDKPLKIKIKIKEVKPDGWIFNGDIIATLGGSTNEIAVIDNRAVREPRFLDGDNVVVYATGNGLAKMKVKSTSGIITKTIDEYEVPCIKIIYTELDNIDSLVANYEQALNNSSETQENNSQSDSAEAGEELGQDLIDAMENIEWDENYSDAEEAGRKAAEYLNKLMGAN